MAYPPDPHRDDRLRAVRADLDRMRAEGRVNVDLLLAMTEARRRHPAAPRRRHPAAPRVVSVWFFRLAVVLGVAAGILVGRFTTLLAG